MAKTVIIDGYEFVTNNFAAILDKPSAPEAFHLGSGLFKIEFHWLCFGSAGIDFNHCCNCNMEYS